MPIPKEKAIFKYISKRNSSLFIIQWFLGLLLKWKSLVCLPSIHYPSFHKTLRLLRGLLTPTIPAQLLSPQLLLTLATVWFEGNCLWLCLPRRVCDPALSEKECLSHLAITIGSWMNMKPSPSKSNPAWGFCGKDLRDAQSMDHIMGFELLRSHLAIKKKVEGLKRNRMLQGSFCK